MSHFDPTDPAAEIKYLKALEQGKGWPVMPPAVDKLKRPLDTPVGKAKKPPRHVARTWGALTPMESRPFVQGGVAPADMARALLILSLLLALALAVD